jgi:hypothetical protein
LINCHSGTRPYRSRSLLPSALRLRLQLCWIVSLERSPHGYCFPDFPEHQARFERQSRVQDHERRRSRGSDSLRQPGRQAASLVWVIPSPFRWSSPAASPKPDSAARNFRSASSLELPPALSATANCPPATCVPERRTELSGAGPKTDEPTMLSFRACVRVLVSSRSSFSF